MSERRWGQEGDVGASAVLSRSVVLLDQLFEDSWQVVLYRLDEDGAMDDPSVSLSRSMWEDFGCPQRVTVTIEPGDLLNV